LGDAGAYLEQKAGVMLEDAKDEWLTTLQPDELDDGSGGVT
jgi:hypothetical protein